MLLSDTIDVMTKIKRQIRHVQKVVATKHVLHFWNFSSAQHLIDKLDRESIVPGRHRSMGGENTFFANRLNIDPIRRRSAGALRLFVQQLQREQARMTLVHVIALDVAMSQCAEHPHPAHAENYFL